MTRTEFTTKIKLAAWQRCNGICEACGLKILGGAEYDHVLPCALGGEATLDNCECLCAKCHRAKTNGDVTRIAKAKRQERKHKGIDRAKRKIASRGFRQTASNTKYVERF